FFNAGVPSKMIQVSFYTFGGVTSRQGTSFALYRAPYWVGDPYNLLHEAGSDYNGFSPLLKPMLSITT
ncbi:hypothetical protein QWY92_02175, partial [Algibacter miyuki]|uniref:hypothetical protein n=1 Tax=Algibacter miyuki TaxID=1306933 RepID=UPI0025B4030A